jgi:uncharacterized protein (TIGR01732 family)
MSDGFVDGGCGFGGGFALLIVLFILLIIVAASFCGGYGGGVAPAYGYGAPAYGAFC